MKKVQKNNENTQLGIGDVSSSSFDDVEFIDALFAEYNKSHNETKPGQIHRRWLNDEQLKWVLTVVKNHYQSQIELQMDKPKQQPQSYQNNNHNLTKTTTTILPKRCCA